MLQEDFAKILDVHKNTLVRFESEKGKPDIDHLKRILEAFPDINPAWLLTGEGEMRRLPVEYPLGETLKNGDMLRDTVRVASATTPPRINGVGPVNATDQPFAWFHEWIDEELVGKSMSEVMRFAVKIKAELDKEREG